jgi:hypothetical protein
MTRSPPAGFCVCVCVGGVGIRIQNTITLLVTVNSYSLKRFWMTTTDSVVLQRDLRCLERDLRWLKRYLRWLKRDLEALQTSNNNNNKSSWISSRISMMFNRDFGCQVSFDVWPQTLWTLRALLVILWLNRTWNK